MFSEASVCPPVGIGRPPPLWAETPSPLEAHPLPHPSHLVAATVAVGTHPTGMHSCFLCNQIGKNIGI